MTKGFPGSSEGKESACNARDLGSVSGLGRSPGGGQGNPLQCSCPENPHGRRSLAGYSPRGAIEPDTTEHALSWQDTYRFVACGLQWTLANNIKSVYRQTILQSTLSHDFPIHSHNLSTLLITLSWVIHMTLSLFCFSIGFQNSRQHQICFR